MLPALDNYPSIDVEQYYYTPYPEEDNYLETRKFEWRVRKITDGLGSISYKATVKYGDKNDGQRLEIETPIEAGSFGTTKQDIDNFAFAYLKKKRYIMADGLIVDHYLKANRGEDFIAEKEFKSIKQSKSWLPPGWAKDLNHISNRLRAINLEPANSLGVKGMPIKLDKLLNWGRQQDNRIVTISGMSGSGKSRVAGYLAMVMEAPIINIDRFHIGTRALLKACGTINHDIRGAYDYDEAFRAARKLYLGESVYLPNYDYKTGGHASTRSLVKPSPRGNVIVEGLHAEMPASSEDLLYNRVFVNTPMYVSLVRRILRDCPIKGIPEREVVFNPQDTLRYMHEKALPSYLKDIPGLYFDYLLV